MLLVYYSIAGTFAATPAGTEGPNRILPEEHPASEASSF